MSFGAKPIKLLKYGVTLRRLDELTDYLARKETLQRKIKAENQYIVPLKPERIEALIKQVQRHGRIISNPYENRKIQITLRQLELMWEESNAFWGKEK